MSLARLVNAAGQVAAVGDRLSRWFARELAKVLRDTERDLAVVIADATAGNRTAIVRATRANQTRREIRDALHGAGYDDLIDMAVGEPLDVMTEAMLATRRLAKQSASLSVTSTNRLDALKTLYGSDLLDMGDTVSRSLWRATVRGVFGSRDQGDILADLSSVIDDAEPHIQTLYDTSVSIYGRQVEALQAGDEPETRFLYLGPADQKTRPFCLKHVGKVYTRKQIDAMDNGQLDNTFLTAGGFNCRHVWMEVSQFSELTDYVGTRQRVPEIQQALDDLQAAA